MFKAEKLNDATKISLKAKRRESEEFRILFISDVHLDNKKCKRDLLKRHLDKAKEIGAPIIDNGDFFDCMGGKYDPRSNKGDILKELQVPNYFDAVTNMGRDFLKPYAKNIAIMSEGNHEGSVLGRHEINLTTNLIDKLNPSIIYQKYSGWIMVQLADGPYTQTFHIYRTHGSGGSAPVTKGAIQSARRQDISLADLYISGHIHTQFDIPRPQWYLTQDGKLKIRVPRHHQIGTYKDSTGSYWEDTKGIGPPSLGGTWLVFKWSRHDNEFKARFEDCD